VSPEACAGDGARGGAWGGGAWRSAGAGRPVRKAVNLARSRCGGAAGGERERGEDRRKRRKG